MKHRQVLSAVNRRLQSRTAVKSATSKEAAAFIKQAFAKFGLRVSVDHDIEGSIEITAASPFGEVYFNMALNTERRKPAIDLDWFETDGFNISFDDSLVPPSLYLEHESGRIRDAGALRFRKYVDQMTKFNDKFQQKLKEHKDWCLRFGKALDLIAKTIADNGGRV